MVCFIDGFLSSREHEHMVIEGPLLVMLCKQYVLVIMVDSL
jgi:hypothetical protein